MGYTSPKHDRLLEALRRLKGSDDPALIEREASGILWHIYMLKARQVEAGRLTSVGPAKELRDLERAARKAIRGKLSNADWATAWAMTHASIRNRIWRRKVPPIVVRNKRVKAGLLLFKRAPLRDVGGSVNVPGLDLLAPKPQDVFDAIKAEQELIKQTAGVERRKRKRDQAEHAAIKAIRSAYQKLTGKKGGRATDANGKLTGRLVRLGREVDQIFGTQLFAEKDSRRLRDNLGDNRP